MSTSVVNKSTSIGGRSYSGQNSSASYGVVTHLEPVTLPAAKTGRLTTRTNDTSGTLTMDSGHGLVDGLIDIYWEVGGVKGCRRDVTVDITGDSGAISGTGYGDVLPPDETDITAVHPVTETLGLNADNLKLIAVKINTDAHASMSVGTGTYDEGAAIELNDGTYGRTRIWDSQTDGTNPLDAANAFTTMKLSQGGTTAAIMQASFAGE